MVVAAEKRVGESVYVQVSVQIGVAVVVAAPCSMRRLAAADGKNGCNSFLLLCCDHLHMRRHVPSSVLGVRETVSLGCAAVRAAQRCQVAV